MTFKMLKAGRRKSGLRRKAGWITVHTSNEVQFFKLDKQGNLIRHEGIIQPHHTEERDSLVVEPLFLSEEEEEKSPVYEADKVSFVEAVDAVDALVQQEIDDQSLSFMFSDEGEGGYFDL